MKETHEFVLVEEIITDLDEMDKILQGFPEANEALKDLKRKMRNTLAELKELTKRGMGVVL